VNGAWRIESQCGHARERLHLQTQHQL